MPRTQTIKKSRITPEEVVVVHSCNQTETLKHLAENSKKLSEIITGNGDPEKGIARKVAIISERQIVMSKAVEDIHESLKEYHVEVDTAKKLALTVHSALEQYKASIEGEAKGEAKVSTRTQVNFGNIISIIGTLLVLAGLIITVIISTKENKILDERINSLGTPVIINSRGLPTQLPDGDSLKYFRDGEFKDGVKNQ